MAVRYCSFNWKPFIVKYCSFNWKPFITSLRVSLSGRPSRLARLTADKSVFPLSFPRSGHLHQVALVTQKVVGVSQPQLRSHVLKEDFVLVSRTQEAPHVAFDPQGGPLLLSILWHLTLTLLLDEPDMACSVRRRLNAHIRALRFDVTSESAEATASPLSTF